MALLMGVAGVTGVTLASPTIANACSAQQVLGVSGVGDGNANAFGGGRVDVQVKYSGAPNDIGGGENALDNAIKAVRNPCPGTFLLIAGYSQGSVIVQDYLKNHHTSNARYVVYANPKQTPNGSSAGAFAIAGPPVAGVSSDFGGVPGVSICNHDDVICDQRAPSGWAGYAFGGKHQAYDFTPRIHVGQNGTIIT